MKFFAFLYFSILKLRYKFEIIGFDNIVENKKYILFPNHQALVDPQIVFSLIGQKINISPVVTETFYNFPVLNYFFKKMGAVSMGDIQRGTGTIDDVNKAFKDIEGSLKAGNNLMIYPAGQLYCQGFEVIKGKKTAYNLVQVLEDDIELLVVKTTGLWGSMWGKAYYGYTPNMINTLLKGVFIIFANLIFFTPRRKVKIEIQNFTNELKNIKNLNEFNKYLEDFYNKDGIEEVNYFKHFFYFNDTKNKKEPEIINGSIYFLNQTNNIDINEIPLDVSKKIIKKIAEMKEVGIKSISINSNLINDLYFDSLDLAEIKTYVQNNFNSSDNPSILDLKIVGDLCLMAIGKSISVEKLKDCNWGNIDFPVFLLKDKLLS